MIDPNCKIEDLLKKDTFSFYDLCDVVRVLRSDVGCPWDREQNHKSIRNDLIEETYEVVEAIDNDDLSLLKEELGDVMLQIVFHSILEEENAVFDIDGVCTDVCKKLIHRHPHVFGNIKADTSKDVLENWDKIKSEEKSRNTVYSTMESIPPMLPALMRARKIGSRAAKVGFDFHDALAAISKIEEETCELKQSNTSSECFEEIGDLLFSVVNAARLMHIDPEEALNNSNKKFMARFKLMEEKILSEGKNIYELDINTMDKYYIEAKNTISNVKK